MRSGNPEVHPDTKTEIQIIQTRTVTAIQLAIDQEHN